MTRWRSTRCLLVSLLFFAACSSKNNTGAGSAGTGAVAGSQAGSSATGGQGGSNNTTGQAGAGGKPGAGTAGKAGSTAGSGDAGSTAVAGTTGGFGGKLALGGAGGTGGASAGSMGDASVLQYHKHASRDGLYVDAAFTKAAAAKLHRDKTFTATVSGQVFAQPLYVEGGPGGKDLVIVATEQNEVTALDAQSGSVVWQRKADVLGMPAATTMATGGCGNIHPLGITGTPVIDAASRKLYFDAMTASGKHMIHALSVDDGMSPSGWPVDVSTVKTGSLTFNSPPQNQRGALAIVGGTLIVPYGGHAGDCGTYHGWVVGVPLDKPQAPVAWATRAIAGGIWAPGGVASDGTSIFFATGNTEAAAGMFSAPASWGDGEAIFKVPPSLSFSGQDADYFAAQNWSNLDANDTDIGGSGPVLFSVPGATPTELAIGLGKDGKAYLLDRAKLGGVGKPLATQSVAGGAIITAAAAYTTNNGTYVVFKAYSGALTALHITAAAPPAITMAWSASPNGQGSPIVTTSDGKAEAIVWYVGAGGDNKLRGYDADSGMLVFSGGGADEQLQAVAKFQTPIVAKGRLFVAAANTVYAFSVN